MATTHEDPMPDDLSEVDEWLVRRRARLGELLGVLPERVPLAFEIVESDESPAYVRHKVVYDTEATMSVPAYLLVPHQGERRGSAVLAIHGHGPGKDHVCGLTATEMPHGDYAHQLALQGHVVLAPDLRCFGERADWNPPDHYACDTNLVHAVMAGWNPLTENLWDLQRSLEVLEALEEVDPRRIGVVGFSYGATMALFLTAVDPRVAAAVVSGYLSSWQEAHKMPWNMCGSQVLPGMLGKLEHLDLAALVAPRPLLVESGTEDLLFPVAAASATVASVRRLYVAAGASERLVHDVFSGEHQWHGEEVPAFLARWLGPC